MKLVFPVCKYLLIILRINDSLKIDSVLILSLLLDEFFPQNVSSAVIYFKNNVDYSKEGLQCSNTRSQLLGEAEIFLYILTDTLQVLYQWR